MTDARQLPLWKTAFDLALHLEQVVRRFPRYHKYTLGSELRGASQRLCALVTRAAGARHDEKGAAIDALLLATDEMKTLLTLAQEVKAFGSFNEFAVAAELAVSLGKQSGGWRRRAQPAASSPRGEGAC